MGDNKTRKRIIISVLALVLSINIGSVIANASTQKSIDKTKAVCRMVSDPGDTEVAD